MTAWWDKDFASTHQDYPQNDPTEALAAGERLLARPDFPHQQQLRENLTWYIPQLPGSKAELTFRVPEGWSCFNPSVAAGPKGELRAIIRTANYVMSPEGRYGGAYDTDGVIRTRNYLADFTDVAMGYQLIEDQHLRPKPSLFPVEGFEDARLFYHRGWRFSATVRERNDRGICQQVMATITKGTSKARSLTVLSQPHDAHEKNWMPDERVYDPRPYFVQQCYPTISSRGWWAPAPYIARSFRGGSQVIRAGHLLHLAVIHESVDFPGQTPHRVYWHRLIRFKHGKLRQISHPFCFQRRGVEFAAGMALQGDDLLISYGVHDQEAWLHRMPLADALGMLHDVTEDE